MTKNQPQHALKNARLLAPVAKPGKYMAIGMNYKKHADEARKLRVGAPAKGVKKADALKHVFGYFVANDVSARDWQQHTNTSDMVHYIAGQIEYLSTAFTLEPGDLIATGTPSGVGIARNPPVFLQPGDVVRCEIDGIGLIENRVRGDQDRADRYSLAVTFNARERRGFFIPAPGDSSPGRSRICARWWALNCPEALRGRG